MKPPFEDLKVWQLAHELALEIYHATDSFPAAERYGSTNQLRRAAVAIPSNIAEGNARHHRREYVQFCNIARGSLAEVKYLLRLSADLGYLAADRYEKLRNEYELLGALLYKFMQRLA
jgi:four helix bundle protein